MCSITNVKVCQTLYMFGQALKAPGGSSTQISGQWTHETGDVISGQWTHEGGDT